MSKKSRQKHTLSKSNLQHPQVSMILTFEGRCLIEHVMLKGYEIIPGKNLKKNKKEIICFNFLLFLI